MNVSARGIGAAVLAAPASKRGKTTHAGKALSAARATLSAGARKWATVPFTVSVTARLITLSGT